MANNLTSPGVTVTEMNYSDYISEVSTCIIGIVGASRKGPTEPTLVTSQAQFIKIFGEPTALDYGAYAAMSALEQADKVYYQRVLHGGVKAKDGATNDKLIFEAVNAGPEYNGIKVEVKGAHDKFSVTITPKSGTKEEFTDLSDAPSSDKYIVTILNGSSNYVNCLINEKGDATFSAKTYTLANGAIGCTKAKTPDGVIKFESRSYDSTINGMKVVISNANSLGTFDVSLMNGDTVVETFKSLSLRRTDDRFVETFLNKYSDYYTCKYTESGLSTITGASYTFSGGTDGISGITPTEVIEAMNAGFSNPELCDIDLLLTPGWSDAQVVNTGIFIAENRQDCLYIIDPPRKLTPKQVVDWTNGAGAYSGFHKAFDTTYAAVYYPWVKVYDNYTKEDRWLPPSGFVAAQMAYSDAKSDPWFAPAGINRGNLTTPTAVEYILTKGERDMLYSNQNIVNPIINFKGQGLVIWGQRTCTRKPSALDRVNVRRLLNYLKKVIAASTAYYAFEPNDEYCREKWVDMVEPKLDAIKARRGVTAFDVVMDRTTVTQDDINNYRMPGIIKIKPTKSAEIIPLGFMIMPEGAKFDEDVSL